MRPQTSMPERTMKTKLIHLLVKGSAVLISGLSTFNFQLSSLAQGTALTYQGRLNANGSAANGSYDFRFRLASDSLGNNYAGGPILSNALPVSGGLFTA